MTPLVKFLLNPTLRNCKRPIMDFRFARQFRIILLFLGFYIVSVMLKTKLGSYFRQTFSIASLLCKTFEEQRNECDGKIKKRMRQGQTNVEKIKTYSRADTRRERKERKGFNLLRSETRSCGNGSLKNDPFIKSLIISNTVESDDHLTPELKLRLITPECKLWHCKSAESKFSEDPFWGIYWPGGQALGRYILDNKELFYQKNILDVGSGSGACALAAAKCRANFVLANDINPVSLTAIAINSQLNNLEILTHSFNLIGEDIDTLTVEHNNIRLNLKWDIILIGDMFYDTEFSSKLFIWLSELAKKGKTVLVGDPGRHVLKDLHEMKDFGTMVKIAEYSLTNKEHNGFSSAAVFRIQSNMLQPA